MKRFWTGVIIAVFAAAVTAAAQEPQSPANPAAAPAAASPAAPQDRPAPPQDRPAASQEKPSTVTFSGCIQNAPAPASAAAAGDKKEMFVLASVKPVGASAGAAVGTSGSATRYELDGTAAELTKHLNHQVEITGTLQSSSASPIGAEKAAPGSAAAAPKLKVTSIKMVSDKCS